MLAGFVFHIIDRLVIITGNNPVKSAVLKLLFYLTRLIWLTLKSSG